MLSKSRVVLFVAVVILLSTHCLYALEVSGIERVRESVGTGKLSSSNIIVVNDFVADAVDQKISLSAMALI